MKLKTKMSVAVFILTSVLMSSVAFFSWIYFGQQFKKSKAEHQFMLVSSLAADLDYKLAIMSTVLQATAVRLSAEAIGTPEKAQAFLPASREALSVFDDGLFLFSVKGKLIAQAPYQSNIRDKDFFSHEYFRQTVANRRPHISAPFRLSELHNPVVMFTAPVFDADGKLIGILGGCVDLMKENLLGKLANTKIGETGHLYLLTSERTLVIHRERSRILENVPVGKNLGLDEAIKGFEGSLENVNSKGNKGITSFKRLGSVDWILVAHFPLAEAYAPVESLKRYYAAIILGAIFLSVIIIRLTMAHLTGPLLRFTNHVAGLRDNPLEKKEILVSTRDEIGTLAETFNSLVLMLEKEEVELKRSKELYQLVADFSTDMAIWRNPNGTMAYVSPQCLEITGYTDTEFYADHSLIERIIYPDDMSMMAECIEMAYCGTNPPFHECRIVRKTNDVRWISHSCRIIHGKNGEPIGLRGSFSDITEKKAALEAVIVQKAFAENLIDNATAPIFVIDSRHRVVFWNRACEELTGFPAEVMIGTSDQWRPFYASKRPVLADLIIDNEMSSVSNYYDKCSNSHLAKEGIQAEGWYFGLGGKDRYIFFDAAPIRNLDGGIIGAIETFHDITDRKLAEDKVTLLKDFYLTLFEEFPALIWRSDTDAQCNYFNKGWLEFTGRELQKEMGEGWTEGVHEEDLECCVSTYLDAFNRRVPFNMEYRLQRHDGEYRWIIHAGRPFSEPDGAFAGYIGVCYDITDRRLAADKLRESQERLIRKHELLSALYDEVGLSKLEWEQTFDCIDDLIILTDGGGNIRRCNRAVTNLAGISKEETLGREWCSVVRIPDMERIGMPDERGEFFHQPTGRWFSWAVYPFRASNSTGESGTVITLHDYTDLKKVGEALEKAYAELKEVQLQILQREKLASIGQLAAGVAHEINNPIGFIMSNLGTLAKYLDRLRNFITIQKEIIGRSPEKEDLERIASAKKSMKIEYVMGDSGDLITESLEGAERVKKIVQDLKSFSRVNEAEVKVVDLHECLDSTINIVWNELKYKVTLNREYGDIPHLRCNAQQLNQVFLNLLVNAGHAIEKQGEIGVRTWQEEGSVYVAISDTGCGIPEEIRALIFDPFFTTKEVGKGTGLGLSISYDIIKKHGGEISVESTPGVGTTFTLRLPQQDVSEQA